MSRTSEKPATSKRQSEVLGTQPLHSLLVPIDLTPISDRVLGRVALLPLAASARITLLHVVPPQPPRHGDHERTERAAKKHLLTEARHLAKALPKGIEIEAVVRVGSTAAEIAACASSTGAELIVMGRGDGRALRETFLGSTAERVIRRGQLPVLAVRLAPRVAYERPAIALDLGEQATDVIASMLRVLPSPPARVAAIHAFNTPYQGAIYSTLSKEDAEAWRNELRRDSTQRLSKLLAASIDRARVPAEAAPLFKLHVRCGSARLVIEKAAKGADTDLLVLGTHGYSGVAYVLLGTVAGDVLRAVACDVLVVPGLRRAQEPE
jgi:nucleotide-binding universal stress UspA family protein